MKEKDALYQSEMNRLVLLRGQSNSKCESNDPSSKSSTSHLSNSPTRRIPITANTNGYLPIRCAPLSQIYKSPFTNTSPTTTCSSELAIRLYQHQQKHLPLHHQIPYSHSLDYDSFLLHGKSNAISPILSATSSSSRPSLRFGQQFSLFATETTAAKKRGRKPKDSITPGEFKSIP